MKSSQGRRRVEDGCNVTTRFTHTPMSIKKKRNRVRNKIAKQSQKRNRNGK